MLDKHLAHVPTHQPFTLTEIDRHLLSFVIFFCIFAIASIWHMCQHTILTLTELDNNFPFFFFFLHFCQHTFLTPKELVHHLFLFVIFVLLLFLPWPTFSTGVNRPSFHVKNWIIIINSPFCIFSSSSMFYNRSYSNIDFLILLPILIPVNQLALLWKLD